MFVKFSEVLPAMVVPVARSLDELCLNLSLNVPVLVTSNINELAGESLGVVLEFT